MKKMILLPLQLLFALFAPLGASVAHADSPPAPNPITIQPIAGFHTINQAAGVVVAVVFIGGAAFALFYIVKGAIAYISAGDNPANATKGRQTIQYAMIGLVVLGLVFVIFKFITGLVPGLHAFFG